MPSKLSKAIKRNVGATVRDGGTRRELVVTLYPGGTIGLRPLRTKREELIDASTVWSYAVALRVRAERLQRKAGKGRR